MELKRLIEHPQHIPTLAAWHQNYWNSVSPEKSVEARMRDFRSEDGKTMPITFIALENDELCGSARLIACDLETRAKLTPWLANLYVHPEKRRHGIAEKLIQKILEQACEMKYRRVYLYTPEQRDYYAKRGWKDLEKMEYRGETITVMVRELE